MSGQGVGLVWRAEGRWLAGGLERLVRGSAGAQPMRAAQASLVRNAVALASHQGRPVAG